ncbi:MAG: SAM-dependent methyltransferase [Gammaproteobacteria bacterium]|nr:SAM-dependent methyltransferase [Gammaproteobacteria bacterium]
MTDKNETNSSEQHAQADDITMSGGGLYSLATKGAKDVIDHATPLVVDAINALNLDSSLTEFKMSDMGCADGGTSLSMVEAALNQVRQHAEHADISVVYSDQPRNDFNALVSIVHDLTDFDSYVKRIDRVYPLFSGSSFYLQAVPDNTLHLGFSATAMHWLSTKPANITNHVHMVGASGEELRAFSNQAKKDWETILACRARELTSGGRLVLINFCRDSQGQYLGNTGGVNMFDNFNENWKEFLSQGIINDTEYENMTLPQYYNTVEEFSDPLTNKSSDCYQAGLRLENIETRVVPCPFAEEFKQHNDVQKFANGLIPTIRSWNESIFLAGLDSSRPLPERKQIIEDYYDTYRQQVVTAPQEHGMGYVHAYKSIYKV